MCVQKILASKIFVGPTKLLVQKILALNILNTVVRAAPSCVRNARERSLGVWWAQIFHLLPENRKIESGSIKVWSSNILVHKNYDPQKIGYKLDKCCQGICCLDKCHHDSWHLVNMVPRSYL